MNPPEVEPLQSRLLDLYNARTTDKIRREIFSDALKHYTSAVALGSAKATLDMLGIEIESMEIIQLTEDQRDKLAAGSIGQYIDGKDRTDD